ncbi:MAG: protein kinase, partial [Myxococcota bacterium]
MTDAASFRFDVFLSHASEDKAQVRALARQLRAAGLTVWFDEERLAPGFNPQTAIARGLEESRHVLIWVTQGWLKKAWTNWELELFAKARSDTRRVLPVLRVPWDDAVLGPYLTRQIAVPPDRSEYERLWLVVCGIRGEGPRERESWASRGQALAEGAAGSSAGEPPAPPLGSAAARLDSAYQRREELTVAGEDTTEVNAEILELRREQRHGPTLHADEYLGEGRFRLIEVIGQGGFATVWKAYDKKAGRTVAIKVLHGQLARVASRRERLFRGAKKMAELQHPHVVRVLVPEGEEQGFYYYVMEYVAGGDLYQAVTKNGLAVERALAMVESIAGALEAAHEAGLVHRDVKPQNILLRESGAVALTDFDLVQAQDTTGGTRTGAMGTVLYSAPEQNEDASRVDHRADIYSLGMTAVFCIHGKKLPQRAMFQRDAFLAGLGCEEALRGVLRRAVELQAEDRFERMSDFRTELAAARRVEASAEASG